VTKDDPAIWGDARVGPGEMVPLWIPVSESYAGSDVRIPALVWRGAKTGPTVCVTAAVHGDEINGTGTIRRLVRDQPFQLLEGTLVLVPVVNLIGFERHSRYLPDRRDLNRCFPGTKGGSLARRLAHAVFNFVVRRCDYGIDLHTAAVRRTNFPSVRADLDNERLAPFARAFGAELIIDGAGPAGSLRREATAAGCATLAFEIGEAWKVESGAVAYSISGITNCLRHLGMVDGEPSEPAYRLETDTTKWIRAEVGGFLEFHVAPGDIVKAGDPLVTNTSLLGTSNNLVVAPRDGIVIGMTTLPAVSPGNPVCHLAFPAQGTLRKIERAVRKLDEDALHERVRGDMARSVDVIPPQPEA